MSNEIKRATGLLVIEAVNSNPNGDPDRESDPRQWPNGRGEISPVSFKRKLRDLLDDHDAPFFKALPEKFVQNEERYRIVEHGVYCMPFFVNPNYAHKSGCTADDIELLKLLIPHAYEMNRSAIRPDVRIRHAWYIEHKNMLGSCPEHLLFEALTPEKLGGQNEPSTMWSDYQDKTALPEELRSRVESCIDLANL